MNVNTHVEDLSNEIFFEIFDYLHALDIFTGFTSLNQRISSILQSIPLRIIISRNCYRYQIDFLSSYLTFHAHQVISLIMHDTIRDYPSVIGLLFNRHNFINLQSCIFLSINPLTKLKNVFKKIQSLNRLVTFSLMDPCFDINENDKRNLTRIMLMHKSSFFRSMTLQHCYNYSDISNYTSISSNLTTLHLRIHDVSVSFYSVVFIFRVCGEIRHFGLTIDRKYSVENNHVNVPIPKLSLNKNDHTILPKVITFNLIMCIMCDIHLFVYILHCMPNLKRFKFFLAGRMAELPFYLNLFNGYVWQQILKRYGSCLSIFEFYIAISKNFSNLNLDNIVNSFQYFVQKYPNWNMVIDRWKLVDQTSEEFVVLRTLNYWKYKTSAKVLLPYINLESYETRSTTTINNHHLFYSDKRYLKICLTKTRPPVTWSSPLYKKIEYLFIEMPIISYSSLWNKLLNNVISRQTTDDDDAQQNVTYLSCFIHLPDIIALEFASEFSIYQWKNIQFILQACPNVTIITICTRLLILSKLIDNSSLIPIYKQIKTIKSITEKIYFPLNFTSKFVQRFPSLVNIELQVLSFDNCVSVINIFVTYLKNLSYIKINYSQQTLLDDPFSRNYIIEKRRQSFPDNIIDEHKVIVKNNGEMIEIWLT